MFVYKTGNILKSKAEYIFNAVFDNIVFEIYGDDV